MMQRLNNDNVLAAAGQLVIALTNYETLRLDPPPLKLWSKRHSCSLCTASRQKGAKKHRQVYNNLGYTIYNQDTADR